MSKFYVLVQDDKFKSLLDSPSSLGLYEFSIALAYGEATVDEEAGIYDLVYNTEHKRGKSASDVFTYFRPVIVFSRKVYDGLDYLKKFPEVRINSPVKSHVAIFIDTSLVGIFDRQRSKYDEWPDGYVVYDLVLRDMDDVTCDIFRVAESPKVVVVSQKFKDDVESMNVKGFSFRELKVS